MTQTEIAAAPKSEIEKCLLRIRAKDNEFDDLLRASNTELGKEYAAYVRAVDAARARVASANSMIQAAGQVIINLAVIPNKMAVSDPLYPAVRHNISRRYWEANRDFSRIELEFWSTMAVEIALFPLEAATGLARALPSGIGRMLGMREGADKVKEFLEAAGDSKSYPELQDGLVNAAYEVVRWGRNQLRVEVRNMLDIERGASAGSPEYLRMLRLVKARVTLRECARKLMEFSGVTLLPQFGEIPGESGK